MVFMQRFAAADGQMDRAGLPSTVQRHCTDIPCCLVFLVCLTGFGWIYHYALVNGNPDHFLGLPVHGGGRCGIDNYETTPFLYFCNVTGSGIAPSHTMCVAECPNPAGTTRNCQGTTVTDYRSRPVGGVLCIPFDHQEARSLLNTVVNNNPVLSNLMTITEVFRAWQPILICAVLAIICGFLYCFFLEKCIFCIFWGSLMFTTLAFLAAGGYLIWQTELKPADFHNEYLPTITSGNEQYDLAAGGIAVALGFLSLCFAMCCGGSINAALRDLRQAADCITDLPSLLLQPLINLVFVIVAVIVMAVGFYYLVSITHVTDDTVDLGYGVTIQYDQEVILMIAFYLFMFGWIVELLNAISQFVTSYAVQMWYFSTRGGLTTDSPACPTLRGLFVAWFFHLGTFAVGSFFIMGTRVARDIMTIVAKSASDTGNPVGGCLAGCCACCLECFRRFLRYMTANAYMDTALNSNGFCMASYHALLILAKHGAEAATLNTTTVLFQIAGLCGIGATGSVAMHLMCTYWPELTDPDSPQYVDNKLAMYAVGGLVSIFMALPFVFLLDHVSDTILFCNAVQNMRAPPNDFLYEDPSEEGGMCCCGRRSPPRRDPAERAALMSPTGMQMGPGYRR